MILSELFESSMDFWDVESPEEIRKMLQDADAREVTFPNTNNSPIYIVGEDVIEWDGKDIYPEVRSVWRWMSEVDVESYYPDYETNWNNNFWKRPSALFHATTEKNVNEILKHGIEPRNETRGIGNRSVGSAVFTTTNYDEAVSGSYGDFIFEIDTGSMTKDGIRPYVSEEPPVIDYKLRSALAHYIGVEYEPDIESGMSEDTVIVHGAIPVKYMTLLD